MKLLKAVLLASLLLALLVGGGSASGASTGLDPNFGNGGRTTVAVGAGGFEPGQIQGMALGPEGRTYVLRHSLLLAFDADGRPATGFGHNGRVAVAPDPEGEVKGLAVDSQGRVLVTGSAYLGDQEREGKLSVTPRSTPRT